MTAKILDGKAYVKSIKGYLAADADRWHPSVAIITIGDNEASKVYVRNKLKFLTEVGIDAKNYRFDYESNVFEKVQNFIKTLNKDCSTTGIMLQLPTPLTPVEERALIDTIEPTKDIEYLTTKNSGMLYLTSWSPAPCTAQGIMRLLDHNYIQIEGRHVVIVGRSDIVGKPLAILMLRRNATVTIAHSYTENLADLTRQADILVSAVGKPKFITADMVKPHSVVVDVGISRVNGKVVGDVDFNNVKEVVDWITPVPGGVGPVTVAMLAWNAI